MAAVAGVEVGAGAQGQAREERGRRREDRAACVGDLGASPPRLTPLLFQAVWSDATAARLGMGRLLGSIDSWLVAAANKEPDVSAARKKRLLLRPLLRPLPRARHGMGMGLRRGLAPCPRRAP